MGLLGAALKYGVAFAAGGPAGVVGVAVTDWAFTMARNVVEADGGGSVAFDAVTSLGRMAVDDVVSGSDDDD